MRPGSPAALLLTALLAFGSGCTFYKVHLQASRAGYPTSLSDHLHGVETLPAAHFSQKVRQWGFLWGVVALGGPDVAEVIDRQVQLAGGHGIANLRFRTGQDFTDFLVAILTAGILFSRSVTVEGDVVRYQE
ncbi:MAG: hypothetical protein HY402_03910 [Elusimicrobia bacterium]|nr:hypothetical protein [Elusimicrobiota bacterium]